MLILDVLHNFELQIMGVILLTAMAAGGLVLWLKRRKMNREFHESAETDNTQNI